MNILAISPRTTVKPLYMEAPYLFSHEAVITEMGMMEHKGMNLYWVRLNETIFHPQGGGQPGDLGDIDGHPVIQTLKERLGSVTHFEVNHCFDTPLPFHVGQTVTLNIKKEIRLLNMCMHSAGHLIAHLIEQDHPLLKVVDGHHFPGEGRIRFEGETSLETSAISERLQRSLFEEINRKTPINTVFTQEGTRTVQIGLFPSVPCGGTHIQTLAELGTVNIRYIKIEKQKISVGYHVGV